MVVTPTILAGANAATNPGAVLFFFTGYEKEGVSAFRNEIDVLVETVVVATVSSLLPFGLLKNPYHMPPTTTTITTITPMIILVSLYNKPDILPSFSFPFNFLIYSTLPSNRIVLHQLDFPFYLLLILTGNHYVL